MLYRRTRLQVYSRPPPSLPWRSLPFLPLSLHDLPHTLPLLSPPSGEGPDAEARAGRWTWCEVQERVRQQGAVAVGLLDQATGESVLGLAAGARVDLHEGVRLVVLAHD